MIVRIAGMSGLAGLVVALLACSPDRTPKVPRDTPACGETCQTAWECGGVLENDLDACIAACDDEQHGSFRICVADTACEDMYNCKVYAPGGGPSDTDPQ